MRPQDTKIFHSGMFVHWRPTSAGPVGLG